jgi:phenylalanyl-tRNA synthetase beta chain
MKVSLKWLRELLPGVDWDGLELSELTSRLDMTGTAVESVQVLGEALDGVLIGQIVEKVRHANADTLWVTQVDLGQPEPVQIVCGATNFEIGDKVPVATVGTVLPGGVTIKKSKLRGELSFGMNCSGRELGIGGDAAGLMILPPDAPVGAAFASWYGMADTVLDLEITPNRPDCLSMRGIAREFGAVLDSAVAPLPANELHESGEPIQHAAEVSVDDARLCPRYTARLIRDVTIGPSPAWLAERIIAAGARPINNVVDITNLVMFETGQPLHAFDYDRIAKNEAGRAQVNVRRAYEGETITTLDDVSRRLTTENLLITDPSGPITLAGVMGAENTEVTDATVNVFLEGALFDPATTSRTSRSFALISEASLRYERGVDIEYTPQALDRAAACMAGYAGGSVAPGMIDEYPQPYERCRTALRTAELERLVGQPIATETCVELLRRLGLAEVSASTPDDEVQVTVPAFRPDLTREVDLIEEVLRLYGMERIAARLPGGRERIGGLDHNQKLLRRIETTLRGGGLNETMSFPFGDLRDYEALGIREEAGTEFARLHNPMSAEQSVLRMLLLPNLLHSVSLNLRHQVKNVQLFEVGTVFTTTEGRKQPKEVVHVAAVLTGSYNEAGWNEAAVALDFYDAKGIVELLVRELCIDRYRLSAADDAAYPFLQPGRNATIVLAGAAVGWIGELHPGVLSAFAIEDPVVAFEFALPPVLKAARDGRPFTPPPRYPGIEFDVALIVDEDVDAETIVQRLDALAKKTPLDSVRLFDVYRGEGIEAGKKSLAFSLSYRAGDRTLTSEELEPVHARIIQKLTEATGAVLRS